MMSTSRPKSTFGQSNLWQRIKAVCAAPKEAAPKAPVAMPAPALAWVDEGRVALRAFDFAHDAEAVCGFQQETYERNFAEFHYSPKFAQAFKNDLRRAAADPHNGLFVLQVQDRICGFLWLVVYENHWTNERYGYVNNLFVQSAVRGRGLGAELMTQSDRFFRSRGVHLVRLSVTVSNQTAVDLYEKCGYETARFEMEKHL